MGDTEWIGVLRSIDEMSGNFILPGVLSVVDTVVCRLLKESLGGNSQTVMLATISPCSSHVDETLSTLRYARQTRTIVNSARVNEDATARIIRGLVDHIIYL